MIKNYLIVALRNLRRNRLYTLINIAGLAVGMACAFLILGFVRFEMRYDYHHRDADRIYRVIREVVYQGQEQAERRMNTGAPLLPLIEDTLPGVEYAARLNQSFGIVRADDRQFVEGRFFFADAGILNVLTLPLVLGDSMTALQKPFSLLVTTDAARKYFGDEAPIGQTLMFKDRAFTVTGVLAPMPPNSHFHADFLASFESLEALNPAGFFSHWDTRTWTYLKLRAGQSPDVVERDLAAIAASHINMSSYVRVDLKLQKLTDIHLDRGSVEVEMGQNRDPNSLYTLSALATVILLIACINFMNLSTARSASRAREVGVRKVMGGHRLQLVKQFLGESLLLSCLGFVFALAMVELALPAFRNLVGKDVQIVYRTDPALPAMMLGLTVVVGLIAGCYPAFYLSAFHPVQVLKGGTLKRGGRGWLRRGLVVVQFALSVGLVAGTMVMYQQHRLLTTRALGFDKEHLLSVPLSLMRDRSRNYTLFKNALLQNPRILGVTVSSNKPGVTDNNGIQIRTPGSDRDMGLGIIYVDPDYVKTLGLDLIDGRDFSSEMGSDATDAVFLNASALQRLGPDFEPGQAVELFYRDNGRLVPQYDATVIGVLRDFNHRPLTDGPPQPLVFAIANTDWKYRYALIRIAPEHILETTDDIERQWHHLLPDRPFRFSFLDADIARVYRAEKRWQTVFTYFAGLAIVVACLGLFGLAAFTAERRTKEIGIRKVMGASVAQIVLLLSREFTWLVLAANVIAWPTAYYFLTRWLQEYTYHVDLKLGTLILSGAIALVIAWLTVSYQAVKAARANPVDALRYE